jgi:hypothetical protein
MSFSALCQAVLTLGICVLGFCGLKKTYSDIPLVLACHFAILPARTLQTLSLATHVAQLLFWIEQP